MNRDQKHYTPTFILEEEQSYYQENGERMLDNHLEKVGSLQSGPTRTIVKTISLPLESFFTSLSYSVCRKARPPTQVLQCLSRRIRWLLGSTHHSLIQHINAVSHKDRSRRNKFMPFIQELCKTSQMTRQKLQEQRQLEETEDNSLFKEPRPLKFP